MSQTPTTITGHMPPALWIIIFMLLWYFLELFHVCTRVYIVSVVDTFGILGYLTLLVIWLVSWPNFILTVLRWVDEVDKIVERRLRTLVIGRVPYFREVKTQVVVKDTWKEVEVEIVEEIVQDGDWWWLGNNEQRQTEQSNGYEQSNSQTSVVEREVRVLRRWEYNKEGTKWIPLKVDDTMFDMNGNPLMKQIADAQYDNSCSSSSSSGSDSNGDNSSSPSRKKEKKWVPIALLAHFDSRESQQSEPGSPMSSKSKNSQGGRNDQGQGGGVNPMWWKFEEQEEQESNGKWDSVHGKSKSNKMSTSSSIGDQILELTQTSVQHLPLFWQSSKKLNSRQDSGWSSGLQNSRSEPFSIFSWFSMENLFDTSSPRNKSEPAGLGTQSQYTNDSEEDRNRRTRTTKITRIVREQIKQKQKVDLINPKVTRKQILDYLEAEFVGQPFVLSEFRWSMLWNAESEEQKNGTWQRAEQFLEIDVQFLPAEGDNNDSVAVKVGEIENKLINASNKGDDNLPSSSSSSSDSKKNGDSNNDKNDKNSPDKDKHELKLKPPKPKKLTLSILAQKYPEKLKESPTINGFELRTRPKLGSISSSIEWWVHLFHYLFNSFEARYWIQLFFAILVSYGLCEMLVTRGTTFLVTTYTAILKFFFLGNETLTWFVILVQQFGLLCTLFLYVGYQSFNDWRVWKWAMDISFAKETQEWMVQKKDQITHWWVIVQQQWVDNPVVRTVRKSIFVVGKGVGETWAGKAVRKSWFGNQIGWLLGDLQMRGVVGGSGGNLWWENKNDILNNGFVKGQKNLNIPGQQGGGGGHHGHKQKHPIGLNIFDTFSKGQKNQQTNGPNISSNSSIHFEIEQLPLPHNNNNDDENDNDDHEEEKHQHETELRRRNSIKHPRSQSIVWENLEYYNIEKVPENAVEIGAAVQKVHKKNVENLNAWNKRQRKYWAGVFGLKSMLGTATGGAGKLKQQEWNVQLTQAEWGGDTATQKEAGNTEQNGVAGVSTAPWKDPSNQLTTNGINKDSWRSNGSVESNTNSNPEEPDAEPTTTSPSQNTPWDQFTSLFWVSPTSAARQQQKDADLQQKIPSSPLPLYKIQSPGNSNKFSRSSSNVSLKVNKSARSISSPSSGGLMGGDKGEVHDDDGDNDKEIQIGEQDNEDSDNDNDEKRSSGSHSRTSSQINQNQWSNASSRDTNQSVSSALRQRRKSSFITQRTGGGSYGNSGNSGNNSGKNTSVINANVNTSVVKFSGNQKRASFMHKNKLQRSGSSIVAGQGASSSNTNANLPLGNRGSGSKSSTASKGSRGSKGSRWSVKNKGRRSINFDDEEQEEDNDQDQDAGGIMGGDMDNNNDDVFSGGAGDDVKDKDKESSDSV